MLITPPLAALVAEGADTWGLLATAGWFTAYCLRGPVEVLLGRAASGRAGMPQADPSVARAWLLLFGVPAFTLMGAVVLVRPRALLLLAAAGLLLGVLYRLAGRGESRSLRAGLLAVAGLSAGGPLYYLAATGSIPHAAWVLTFATFAFFGGSVFRVKALARERRHPRFRWLSVLLHLAFVTGAGMAARMGWAPALLAVALTPSLLFATYGAWRGGSGLQANLGRVGRIEMGLTLLFAMLLVLGLRL